MSAASSAVFRIAFGLVALVLIVRFFAHGWIDSLLLDPVHHFKYPGFTWVQALPPPLMYALFAALALTAAAMALGYRQRLSAAFFAVGFAYVELIDRTNYLNHYYWIFLTAVVLAFVPLSGMWSVDSRRGRVTPSRHISEWIVWLLRFQVGMVYLFAGVAKLNSDWLFRAEPLATWLPARSDLWLVGPLLAVPATAFVLSWAGALFDLTIVGWLLNKRTRLPAYLALVGFHSTTWLLFPSIGVFPLVMGVGALIFFEPDWPLRAKARRPQPAQTAQTGSTSKVGVALVALYVVLMIAIPLRHFTLPGDVHWNGDGYLFSWHVMLNEKAGSADFIVTDDNGTSWVVGPPGYLTDRQVAVMSTNPDMIRRTAELIASDLGVSVKADVQLSFNGRRSVQFTDPKVVLAPEATESDHWIAPAPST